MHCVTEDPFQSDDKLGLCKEVHLGVLNQLGYILQQTTVCMDVDTITPGVNFFQDHLFKILSEVLHADKSNVTHLLLPAEPTEVVQQGLIVVSDRAQGHSMSGGHLNN